MKKAIIAIVLIAALGGGGFALWSMNGGGASYGKAAPVAGVASIPYAWFLTEGELSLGNAEIRTPIDVNVRLSVDSDNADTLIIKNLGIKAPLLADQETDVHFHAHKLGKFDIVLKSTGQALGTIEIYQPQDG